MLDTLIVMSAPKSVEVVDKTSMLDRHTSNYEVRLQSHGGHHVATHGTPVQHHREVWTWHVCWLSPCLLREAGTLFAKAS